MGRGCHSAPGRSLAGTTSHSPTYPEAVHEVEPLVRTPEEQAEEDAFLRLYGRWAPMSPTEVGSLVMAGFDRPWWIVGGWAIDAACGARREHEDVDVSMLASDVPALFHHVKGRWHLWNNRQGTLTPLSEAHPEAFKRESQLWIRRDAGSPWVADVILVDDRDGKWVSRRDPQHAADVAEVTWVHSDGVRYQRPEIVLLHKATRPRPKDERDLRRAWPSMTREARRWLVEEIERLYPGHAWLELVPTLG